MNSDLRRSVETKETTDFYQLYEAYSTSDIIDLSLLFKQEQPEEWIRNSCYHLLVTDKVEGFEDRLRHNLLLAQLRHDQRYITYIKNKFKIHDQIESIDLTTWKYRQNKITLRLKSTVIDDEKKKMIIVTNPELAKMLDIDLGTPFKYRSQLIRLVHKYIYDHNLQSSNQRQVINPDELLSKVLKPLSSSDGEYTYFNLPGYLVT